jgi:peptidoglycan hydrolase-like protein with peptidoglycan-binding domain
MALGNAAISESIAKIWYSAQDSIPGVRLGGVFADKRGYHNTRKRNQEKWPGDYSIKLDMDLKGSALLASAIDLTMSTTEMKKRTGYLRRAALDARDTRLRALREFIGTLDGSKVYCRIGSNAGLGQGRGSDDWGRDSTHLWHAHLSILRAFANDGAALEGINSVLAGETWEAWVKRKWGGSVPTLPISGIPQPTLREGDEGPEVLALQVYLNGVINAGLTEDGRYGPATTAAVRELQRRARITEDGIYGDDSETALRDLLEDDMPLSDADVNKIRSSIWSYTNKDLTTRDAYAHLRDGAIGHQVLAEVKAGKLREEAILAALKGVDTKAVIAAVNAAAAADAQRDAAGAERDAQILALVEQVGSGELAAEAVVAEIGRLLSGAGA